MLSWEFPPMKVGGLSAHVEALSRELAAQGTEVHVVTCHADGAPAHEEANGVQVHRVRTYQSGSLTFMEWVMQLNLAMYDYVRTLNRRFGPFDLLHAHDWLVGEAAVQLKRECGLPLIATIHATEHGRNHGLHTDLQRSIHAQERELAQEAELVIGCSRYMEREIRELFGIAEHKLTVIPNGVFLPAAPADPQQERAAVQAAFAGPGERIVFFVGRLVREKGAHVLLESAPLVLEHCPQAVFVIAGKGPALEELRALAESLGVSSKVRFAGYIDDETRNRLYRCAAVSVFPSLYEPFGIVALEAMAAGAPLVVSGTGGLQEIVDHERDGFTVLPGDRASLAHHLIRMLRDEPSAAAMAAQAMRKVAERFGWARIASLTADAYERLPNSRRKVQSERIYAELKV
ncbi:hypothetical protein SD70_10020 [Gordoniibacillus kamchatkensis]|uniref:Uncharacterized protein n=2 Tax=Gordoniibacillus kamchatkensis TaxID=1590651 RepID=A0ABR5AIX3_9BACL|nr:hypothetical protein SD70_10020 [Paenibacillus sp. VKM B-2647]